MTDFVSSRVRCSWVAGIHFGGRRRGSQGCPAGEPGLSDLGYWSKRLWAKWVARRDGNGLLEQWQPPLRMEGREAEERGTERIGSVTEQAPQAPGSTLAWPAGGRVSLYSSHLLAEGRHRGRRSVAHVGSYVHQEGAGTEPSSPDQLHNVPLKRLLPSCSWPQLADLCQQDTSSGLISKVVAQRQSSAYFRGLLEACEPDLDVL